MAIDFFEGLASTANDVLNPLLDLVSKALHFFSPFKEGATIKIKSIEPFR